MRPSTAYATTKYVATAGSIEMPPSARANMQMAGNAIFRTPKRSMSTPANGIAKPPVICAVSTAEASVALDQLNSAVIGPTSTPNGKRIIGPLQTMRASAEPRTTSQGRPGDRNRVRSPGKFCPICFGLELHICAAVRLRLGVA
jgi:hypothetical protein